MDEIHRTIGINPKIESYEGFFDFEWKKTFLETIRHSLLREPGFDLARGWEAISNARQIPWLMVKCLDARMYQRLDECIPWDSRKISILRDKLVAKIEARGEKMRPALRKKIQEAIAEVDNEALEMRKEVRDQVFARREDLWDGLVKYETFHTSLWSSERMCYGSLYYGYEWFLTKCVGIKRAEPGYRWFKITKFATDFEAAFGGSIANECLQDKEIFIARLARHALVHNGGRMTDELRREPHTFWIAGDEIQINSEHTTSLYRKLASRVMKVAEHAVTLPEFK